ncbi:DUF6494 family protein [Ramlibacter sp. AN1133]|uniref:DUF6494 family protein n=1 Tax=Ramlibacter sp. AN1133 TaxID=3133429 RepID=UPI0030BB68FE
MDTAAGGSNESACESGVSSQREIEHSVARALQEAAISGTATFPARMTLEIAGHRGSLRRRGARGAERALRRTDRADRVNVGEIGVTAPATIHTVALSRVCVLSAALSIAISSPPRASEASWLRLRGWPPRTCSNARRPSSSENVLLPPAESVADGHTSCPSGSRVSRRHATSAFHARNHGNTDEASGRISGASGSHLAAKPVPKAHATRARHVALTKQSQALSTFCNARARDRATPTDWGRGFSTIGPVSHVVRDIGCLPKPSCEQTALRKTTRRLPPVARPFPEF